MKDKKDIIIIILSVLTALFFALWILTNSNCMINDSEWNNAYEDLNGEWCEIFNDHSITINDLLDELEYYNPEYSEVYRLEEIDCSQQ